MAVTAPLEAPAASLDRVRARVSPASLAAIASFAIAAIVYVRTLLPGVSFGDWAESELLLSRLGILHPTGYPLYSLIGKLFSLIPYESLAWRANLLSATAAAATVGVAVLIAVRLGVRPVVAMAAALSLAFTGTVWEEATFSEMNTLHMLLVALLLHRALVWRDERRTRDLFIGALLAGLCVSNHALAISVVPIVILFVLVDARREVLAHPLVLVKSFVAFAIGLLPYLFLPLRALAGPADVYGPYLTWKGLFDLVSGAMFRQDMHFLSIDSASAALADVPRILGQLVALSDVVFMAAGIVGLVILLVRDRWFGILLAVLAALNVYIYANYLGDLPHYLLATWLILAIGVAIGAETVVRGAIRWFGDRAAVVQALVFLLPIALLAANWPVHDQSANHDGEKFAAEVFAQLPPNAVLITYWDALTTLSYEHCNEGVRPDVSLRAYDSYALVTCDKVEAPATSIAAGPPRVRAAGPGRGSRGVHRARARRGLDPGGPVGGALSVPRADALPARRARHGPLRCRSPIVCSMSAAGRGSNGSGRTLIDRPLPTALGARLDPDAWREADLRFERERGWSGDAEARRPWPIEIDGITLELRTTEAGQVGLFPEHAAMLPWLRHQVAARTEVGETPAVLHLFAYTGLATLAMAAAGARVTHVDASRPTVGWARHNADLSGLAERPVRWIVDDAAAFTDREVRRGRRYAGVVLDPPSLRPRAWGGCVADRATTCAPLLDPCAARPRPDGFLLLTAHTPELGPDRLATRPAGALGRPASGRRGGRPRARDPRRPARSGSAPSRGSSGGA